MHSHCGDEIFQASDTLDSRVVPEHLLHFMPVWLESHTPKVDPPPKKNKMLYIFSILSWCQNAFPTKSGLERFAKASSFTCKIVIADGQEQNRALAETIANRNRKQFTLAHSVYCFSAASFP
jgi:hypothetical protein